ncbi:uncharacterized protein PAC_16235 [Phialocephala subalpina]|uniref:Kinesin light chain n=1 Tax=Phialocephala subalpina TaxID=576137 RepID=A0A1L7XMV3_9HELO|nr:uncharacterized protein PAC_16235 [Phialocephala subalpina]
MSISIVKSVPRGQMVEAWSGQVKNGHRGRPDMSLQYPVCEADDVDLVCNCSHPILENRLTCRIHLISLKTSTQPTDCQKQSQPDTNTSASGSVGSDRAVYISPTDRTVKHSISGSHVKEEYNGEVHEPLTNGIDAGDDSAKSTEDTSTIENLPSTSTGFITSLGSSTFSTLSTADSVGSVPSKTGQIVQHYSNSKSVPGTARKIYPNAPIGIEHQNRFPVLVDFFKRAVDNDSTLKFRTKDINYELRMCGNTPREACPTITVFCVHDIFDKLRKLLNSSSIKSQYRKKEQSILSPVRRKFSRTTAVVSPPVLQFALVFWREQTSVTNRKSTEDSVEARTQSVITMCGSLVRVKNRISTLTLVVEVDSKLYGMTVDHVRLNRGLAEAVGSTRASEPSSSGTSARYDPNIERISATEDEEKEVLAPLDNLDLSSSPDIHEDLWTDDVEYEDLNFENASSLVESGSAVDSSQGDYDPALEHLDEQNAWEEVGHFRAVTQTPSSLEPYLDWALIQFHDRIFERPNAFSPEDDPEQLRFITGVADRETEHVNVIMISGVSGIRKGIILPGCSFIGNTPGHDMSEAWVVDFQDSRGVADGDCGSLIVSAETMKVYGHVVAANPLGQAYATPIRDTFEQIRIDLGAVNVSIPDPLRLLASLQIHYNLANQLKAADSIESLLISAIDPTDYSVRPLFGLETRAEGSEPLIDTMFALATETLSMPNNDGDPLVAARQGVVQDMMRRIASGTDGEWAGQFVCMAAERGHVKFALELLNDERTLFRKEERQSIRDLASKKETEGAYEEASDLLKRLAQQKIILDLGLPEGILDASALARVLEKQGSYEEAQKVSELVSEVSMAWLGESHPETLTCLDNLAQVLEKSGLYDKAETQSRHVLELRKTVLGENHPGTITSMSNLAQVLEKLGRYGDAEELNRSVLRAREDILGPNHLDTLVSINNLAHILSSEGNFEEAEVMARRALEGYKALLGPEHPFTLTSLSNLSQILEKLKNHFKAEELCREALTARERRLGPLHPDTLTSMNNLAQILRRQGKFLEAEAMSERAYEGYKTTLGPDHPFTLTSLSNLAQVLTSQRKLNGAEVLHRQVLVVRERTLGVNHPSTLNTIRNLSQLYIWMHNYEAGIEMSRKLIAGSQPLFGPVHLSTLASVYSLALCLHKAGKHEEAALYYRRARTGFEQSLGANHPTSVACTKNYASMQEEIALAQQPDRIGDR